MNNKQLLIIGATLGLLSVIFGSFGAHGFEKILEANGRTDTYELAVRYQCFHAIAFLFAGLWAKEIKWAGGYAWLAGVILFCGSLYALALTNSTAPYIVFATPLGGLTLIIGWTALIIAIVYLGFGAWAFAITKNPFFAIFIVPGALLFLAASHRTPNN